MYMVDFGVVGVGCLVWWLLHEGARGVKCEWSCSNSAGYNNCYRLAGRRLLWLWSQCWFVRFCFGCGHNVGSFVAIKLCTGFSYLMLGYLIVFVC